MANHLGGVTIPELTPFRVAACAEPLGVTLHAVARAGAMLGRKVLVSRYASAANWQFQINRTGESRR